VLIPPIGLPAPPGFHSVASSMGVIPLVVLLVALVALSAVLGVRLVRKSR
jgi:UPF0716 family protein affecting phage T7 exclusion